MQSDQEQAELERLIDADDPVLHGLAGAILDGTPVDWHTAASGPAASYVDELRLLAGFAAVQRSLVDPAAGASLTARRLPPSAAIGQWGTLTLLERIGEGAFGEVFRAWDRRLDREVALKLLHAADEPSDDDAYTAIEEGRLLARVRHPNVVSVFGAERVDGRVGVWTEFIHGRTLADWMLEHGRFSAQEAVTIGVDLCRALSAVHHAGLLHRDVKPQNVMREKGGRIVLMDFGAGKDRLQQTLGGASELTGTPLYLAPELLQGATATPESDLYSVGVLLYHLVTAAYPVRGATIAELREEHEAGRRRLLRDERPDLPDAFIQIVERAIAPDRTDRYESAGALEAALGEVQRRPQRLSRRSFIWISAAAIIIVVGIAVAIMKNRPDRGGAPQIAAPVVTETRRRLPLPPHLFSGRPSQDGRYISYVDPTNFDLWLWNVATGESRRVTNKGKSSEQGASSVPSPDATRIAYGWLTLANVYELRLINADGTDPRLLLPSNTASVPIPIEWSRDGSRLLCWLDQKDGRRDLALVPVDGSPHKTLMSFAEGAPSTASLSPDGRFVVFDAQASSSESQRDLFIAGTDGSRRRPLLQHPADDRLPLWTSDGRVVFLSNRLRQIDAFVLAVADGIAQGDPALAARSLAGARPVALTDGGTFLYRQSTSNVDVYTASVDLDTALSLGKPVPVPGLFFGERVGPTWSPDGRWLAFVDRSSGLLNLKNLVTGTIRELAVLSGLGNMEPRWSPDSTSIIVRGTNRQNRIGYFRVNLRTGETTPAVLFDAPDHETDYGGIDWSHDGASVLYGHVPRGIVSRHLATGAEVVLVGHDDLPPHLMRFKLSPDGRSIAVAGPISEEANAAIALRVRTDGEPFRELATFAAPGFLQGWSADGRYLTFTRRSETEGAPFHLWVIPAGGGNARDLGSLPGSTRFNNLVSVSPDGRQVAYTQGRVSSEPWIIEHFLPPVRPAPADRRIP